jgi:hypothetical protein
VGSEGEGGPEDGVEWDGWRWGRVYKRGGWGTC